MAQGGSNVFYLTSGSWVGSGGLKLVEIQLLLKRDVMFFKGPRNILSVASVTGPNICRLKLMRMYLLTFQAKDTGLRLLHSFTVLVSLADITDFIMDTSRKNVTSHPLPHTCGS